MPSHVLRDYHLKLVSLDKTRQRLEALYASGHLSLVDLHSAYESLYLRALVGLERFCETLFLDILCGKIRYSPKKVGCRLTGFQRSVMFELLLQGRKYLDWLPIDFIVERRIGVYLTTRGDKTKSLGRPFLELTKDDKKRIAIFMTIRNAITHSSEYAKKAFETEVIGGMPLLAHERTPAGYLRSLVSTPPPFTQFEAHAVELGTMAAKIYGKPVNH